MRFLNYIWDFFGTFIKLPIYLFHYMYICAICTIFTICDCLRLMLKPLFELAAILLKLGAYGLIRLSIVLIDRSKY